MSNYVFAVTVRTSFDDTVQAVTAALQQEGFGVLSRIDVAATLEAKLGIAQRPYLILGACNPHYASQALRADADIGALLPCNVVVREEADGRVRVAFMDPAAVLGLVQHSEVDKLGREVREKLQRVAKVLSV